MNQCDMPHVKDQLPDLAAGMLSDPERGAVEAHVACCGACAEELRIIETVRSMSAGTAAVDIAAIVRRLPQPMRSSVLTAPLRHRRVAWAVRAVGVAATVVLMAGGAWRVWLDRSVNVPVVTARIPVVVSVGDAGDLTDAEVQQVVDRLDQWDGAPASEGVSNGPQLLPTAGQGQHP